MLMHREHGADSGKVDNSGSSARSEDIVLPEGVISYYPEADDTYTALIWIEYPDEAVPAAVENIGADIQARFVNIVGRDYEKSDAKTKVKIPHLTAKKKVLIVVMVVLLSCLPVIPSLYSSTVTQSSVTVMDNPELVTYTVADNITIETIDGSDAYLLKYLGSDTGCTWYIYCNEDSAYTVSNNSYVKRDFTKIGTGTSVSIDGGTMHIGSYQIKLVTNNSVYTGTVVIDGDINTTYTWKFVGEGGLSVINSIRVAYRFDDYYVFETNTDIGRSSTTQVADFAVTESIVDDVIQSLDKEYMRHYYLPDSDWYINYILAFVQECFDYPQWTAYPDLYLYGQYEYFAYPMETLFHGLGDCDDTSILCAALFDGAGYSSAVTLLYADSDDGRIIGHSTSAVNLVKLVSYYNVPSGYEDAHLQVGDITYYMCETTTSEQMAAGYIQEKYLQEIKSTGRVESLIYPVVVNDE